MGVALDSVRECSHCGDVKQLVAFATFKGRNGEKYRRGICKQCREKRASVNEEAMREYRRNYNKKTATKRSIDQEVRRAEAKAFVDAHKCATPCADCGRKFHPVVSVSPVAKKRVGESLYNSKLTDDMVRALRTDRGNGDTHKKLSVKYGVSQSVVSDILAGKTWSHVVDIPSSWREAYEVACRETVVLA